MGYVNGRMSLSTRNVSLLNLTQTCEGVDTSLEIDNPHFRLPARNHLQDDVIEAD